MSIYYCSRLYRPFQLKINTCPITVINHSQSLRWYTNTRPTFYQKTSIRSDQVRRSTINASQEKIIKPRFRPGDWICPHCQFHNHSHRSKCGECSTKADASLRQAQRGDWICPHCEYYNFRQRLSCKQCEELRPSPSQLLQQRQQHNRHD